MKLVYVHNNTLDAEWHRAEWRENEPTPLRQALCNAVAQTVSASDSYDSWAVVWSRAIDPAGHYCETCERLAQRLTTGIDNDIVDTLLSSVFSKK